MTTKVSYGEAGRLDRVLGWARGVVGKALRVVRGRQTRRVSDDSDSAAELERRRTSLQQVGDTVLYDLMRESCTQLGGTYVHLSRLEERAGGDGTRWDQAAMLLDDDAEAIGARDRDAQVEAILHWDAERQRLAAVHGL
ncbi:hypothetical protein [Luteipulveratus halotolerans]|uniref:Uncharacterized protein n=1 Tax=Luteipulveratus halotolerans TaxID=1631356 RepID=A0A0L6CML0_9MICO|nr:hypothetical protein [Luteipulveratus halotolerans]KNX38788.1 hypothetical protein VV01_19225 [Luteipulveratus halotolerans]